MSQEKILGIIPARGGSKGIPHKNIRSLGGEPLIAYSIKSALKSRIGRIIVSTDDPEIAEVARGYGVEVPFLRPAHLAEDSSSSLSVLLHVLEYVETQEQYYPHIVACLPPTTPFRTATHIDAAIEMLVSSDVDSVIGICEVEQHPYVMFEQEPDDRLTEFIQIRPKPLRRQEFPRLYVTNASMTVSRRHYYDGLTDPEPAHSWTSLKGIVMDRVSSIDINTEFDLLVAEAALSALSDEPQKCHDPRTFDLLIAKAVSAARLSKRQYG